MNKESVLKHYVVTVKELLYEYTHSWRLTVGWLLLYETKVKQAETIATTNKNKVNYIQNEFRLF